MSAAVEAPSTSLPSARKVSGSSRRMAGRGSIFVPAQAGAGVPSRVGRRSSTRQREEVAGEGDPGRGLRQYHRVAQAPVGGEAGHQGAPVVVGEGGRHGVLADGSTCGHRVDRGRRGDRGQTGQARRAGRHAAEVGEPDPDGHGGRQGGDHRRQPRGGVEGIAHRPELQWLVGVHEGEERSGDGERVDGLAPLVVEREGAADERVAGIDGALGDPSTVEHDVGRHRTHRGGGRRALDDHGVELRQPQVLLGEEAEHARAGGDRAAPGAAQHHSGTLGGLGRGTHVGRERTGPAATGERQREVVLAERGRGRRPRRRQHGHRRAEGSDAGGAQGVGQGHGVTPPPCSSSDRGDRSRSPRTLRSWWAGAVSAQGSRRRSIH